MVCTRGIGYPHGYDIIIRTGWSQACLHYSDVLCIFDFGIRLADTDIARILEIANAKIYAQGLCFLDLLLLLIIRR